MIAFEMLEISAAIWGREALNIKQVFEVVIFRNVKPCKSQLGTNLHGVTFHVYIKVKVKVN
jgi:hypothetical protein